MQCCDNCWYSRVADEGILACHRYPPTITKAEGNTVTSHFPLMRPWVWCGEWRKGGKATRAVPMNNSNIPIKSARSEPKEPTK